MVGIWFYRTSTEFLASLRGKDHEVTDEIYVFVPVSFLVLLFVDYFILMALESFLGVPLGLDQKPSLQSALLSGGAFAIVGAALGALLLSLTTGAAAFWRECQRGWLTIYPLCAVILWLFLGWTSGTAAVALVLGVLALWSIARLMGFEGFAVIPWLFLAIYGTVFAVQYGISTAYPPLSEFSEYLRPFGFIYHAAIFFGLSSIIQRGIWLFSKPRAAGDTAPPRVVEVVAGGCNPLFYVGRTRKEGRRGPDVAAAEGSVNWVESVRHALQVGGRQGAEFGVTLASIELVVQVLSITGIGNKFALLIETLSHDICFFGAASGGACVWGLGLDGFFVGLFLTAVACAMLGVGMPTTAAYVLLAILGGPALIALVGPEMTAIHGADWTKSLMAIKGDRVASHMFIFYFAILSAITPPVAIASLVGAKVAGAPYFKTSMMSLRFAIVGFVVPFLFMYQPALLALDSFWRVVTVSGLTLLAFIAFSASAQGFFLQPLKFLDRLFLFISSVLVLLFVITFHWFFLLAGAVVAVVALIGQFRARARSVSSIGSTLRS
jgi:TRAP-type uncharacterized transport system fused permease subunit